MNPDKQLIDSILIIVQSQGFWKFILLFIIVAYGIPLGRVLYKGFEFLINFQNRRLKIKQKEYETALLIAEKEEKSKMFESFKLAIDQVKIHNDLIEIVMKALQLSPSNYKYEVLLESFLGIDRSFNNDAKAKIMYYLESGKRDKFIYIKKEIINSMKDKVFNKLSLFIFNDIAYMDNIFEKARISMETFLDTFEQITDVDEAKFLLDDDDKGIMPVLQNILREIVVEYYTVFSMDTRTDYLRRKDI